MNMAKIGYFSPAERVEMAHLMAWMFGCTEYGLLSPKHYEVGYYDRITGKSCPHLKQTFIKKS